MEGFIARANIDHYRHLLKTECDEVKRQVILRLIAEEETKLAQEMAAAGNKNSSSPYFALSRRCRKRRLCCFKAGSDC